MWYDFLEYGITTPYYFFKEFNKSINSMPQITDIWTWQISASEGRELNKSGSFFKIYNCGSHNIVAHGEQEWMGETWKIRFLKKVTENKTLKIMLLPSPLS